MVWLQPDKKDALSQFWDKFTDGGQVDTELGDLIVFPWKKNRGRRIVVVFQEFNNCSCFSPDYIRCSFANTVRPCLIKAHFNHHIRCSFTNTLRPCLIKAHNHHIRCSFVNTLRECLFNRFQFIAILAPKIIYISPYYTGFYVLFLEQSEWFGLFWERVIITSFN